VRVAATLRLTEPFELSVELDEQPWRMVIRPITSANA
jgi:hypothetical protein